MIPSFLSLSQKFKEKNLLFHEHTIHKRKKKPKESRSLMNEIFQNKPSPIYPIVALPKFYTITENSLLKKSGSSNKNGKLILKYKEVIN